MYMQQARRTKKSHSFSAFSVSPILLGDNNILNYNRVFYNKS